MIRPRVIPCLLLDNRRLVKTVKFKNPVYVGDPLNAVKIFNEKGVDELIFLDIRATIEKRQPDFETIRNIASECFMPVCYGGGIKDRETIREIFKMGIEKISLSSQAVERPDFIKEASREFGSQSIMVCIDVKNFGNSHEVVTHNAQKRTGIEPSIFAMKMEEAGAGELLVNSVDRDGTMTGYDIELINKITRNASIPVIACGGAGKLEDLRSVIMDTAASCAAGSLFIFYGSLRAVLINYPEQKELEMLFA